jgi:hypothetical protein
MRSYKYTLIKSPASLLALGLICFLGGCDDPAPEPASRSVAAPDAPSFSIAQRQWLDIKDKISPAVWLASREASRDVSPDDPAARTLRELLGEADRRFSEGPRMIANRAVQVEAMLAEQGVREAPRQVIEGLVSIAETDERAGFGETCQHYVNARVAAPTREAALELLRRRPLPSAPEGADEP